MSKKKQSFKFTPNEGSNKKNKSGKKNVKQQMFSQLVSIVLFLVVIVTAFSLTADRNKDEKTVSLSQVATAITNGEVAKIDVNRSKLTVSYINETEKEAKKEDSTALSETLVNLGVTATALQGIEITITKPSGFAYYLSLFAPYIPILLILAVAVWFFTRGGKGAGGGAMQAFSFGSTRARYIDPSDTTNKLTFKDVAGAEEAKQELEEIVDFLKNPKKFQKIGAEIPRGALLMGSPGTGKTLLARAVAGEAGVPFFSVSASEFVEMFVGVGASRVRDLFKMAKKEAPAIIFIDEIDAIGRVRGGGTGGGNDEREQTLNQILVEMDGFEKNESVIVIAATNRPEVLDPALLRPGRFDRRVVIDLPDRPAREAILGIHAKKKPLADEVTLLEIARRTPGFSGADLFSVMNEAAIFAARAARKQVTQNDLVQAIEKVAMGPERKSSILTPEEKRITAYHEVGHAIMATVLEDADPVAKVTVMPRGRALGYVFRVPEEDRKMKTRNDFLADIAVGLAGYVTEKNIFGDVSTGPANDLQQVTAMAREMVTKYGMSEKAGVMAWEGNGQSEFGGAGARRGEYSDETATMLDEEVKKIITEQYNMVEKTLKKYEKALHGISEKLLEEETYDREEYEKVVKEFGLPINNRAMKQPKGGKKY